MMNLITIYPSVFRYLNGAQQLKTVFLMESNKQHSIKFKVFMHDTNSFKLYIKMISEKKINRI